MLDRLYTSLGGKDSAANDKPYADDAQLGDWARSSVYAMREIGIMQGKDCLLYTSRRSRIFNKAHQKRISVIRDIRHGKLGKLTAARFFRVD